MHDHHCSGLRRDQRQARTVETRGESFDGLLDRLSRNETDIDAVAGSFDRPEDEGLAESVTRAHEELNRSLERRVDESEQ